MKQKPIPVKVQKLWTKTERESAKLSFTMTFRSGKKKIKSPVTILRPVRMTTKHLNVLNFLISTYGTAR